MGWKSEVCNVLRTTDKIQGKYAFFNFDNNGKRTMACALGVLICNKHHVEHREDFSHLDISSALNQYKMPNFALQYEDNTGSLWTEEGLVSTSPHTTLENFIVHLNDKFNLTFSEIADCLEATFPEDD